MIIVPTYLEKSPLHGFGVFAKEFIAKGTKVWEFHEKIDLRFSPEEFMALPPSVREEIEIHMYEPEAGGAYYYETTMGKYMNHSRDPNVDFALVNIGTATRDIQKDEELLCDYRQFMHSCEGIEYI